MAETGEYQYGIKIDECELCLESLWLGRTIIIKNKGLTPSVLSSFNWYLICNACNGWRKPRKNGSSGRRRGKRQTRAPVDVIRRAIYQKRLNNILKGQTGEAGEAVRINSCALCDCIDSCILFVCINICVLYGLVLIYTVYAHIQPFDELGYARWHFTTFLTNPIKKLTFRRIGLNDNNNENSNNNNNDNNNIDNNIDNNINNNNENIVEIKKNDNENELDNGNIDENNENNINNNNNNNTNDNTSINQNENENNSESVCIVFTLYVNTRKCITFEF